MPGGGAKIRRPGRWLLAAFAGPAALLAANAGVPAAGRETITDPARIWAMPGEQKTEVHPLRLEGRVAYYDAAFKLCWLQRDQVGTYVQLGSPVPEMQTGQRVLIEGTIIPAKGLSADLVRVTVLRDFEPVEPLDAKGRINDLTALQSRVVSAEAYVDGQQLIDPQHVRLSLVIENRPVIGWIKPDDPAAIPRWQGQIVRVQGLYSARFDPTQTRATIEIWMGRQTDLQVLGSIADYAAFDIGTTPINRIFQRAPGTLVRIRGRVEAQTLGSQLVVRDSTGQVAIRSIQLQHVAPGTEIEALGRVALADAGWVLEAALFRLLPAAPGARVEAAGDKPALRTVAQIRGLSAEEAGQGRPVNIAGMVTWSLPANDFFFVQDVSDGVRVRYDRTTMETPQFGKHFQVEGVTYRERQTPAVKITGFKDLGSMSPPTARPVTFEQAVTGREDGQWIELHGFFQRVVSEGDWRWIYVTTPAGEFVAHLQTPVSFAANPGSLIRVHGVCETTAGRNGQVTGVTIRVPFLHDITIEEDAPSDFYNLPLRSIQSLDQLSSGQAMTRVRIAGVVLHAAPGRLAFVQEGAAAVLVLSHETEPLVPGDRIEAVGILGREGARTVLREAVYRKTAPGPVPVPRTLEDPADLAVANDSQLVRVRGTLIDEFDLPGLTRLTVQAGKTIFECVWERPAGAAAPEFALGTGLELTGLYRLEFDDSRQMRGFQLQLRSPADIVVFQKPRLWTVPRALAAVAVLGGCTLLGLGWIAVLRRQVRRQTAQIREQLEHRARLELEVQRAARLESLGVLAGGIAHDFNNALTGIMGYTSIAMLDEKAMALVGDLLREIERGAHRARDLTQQLLTFAKGGDPVRTNISLPDAIHDARALVLHGANVRCEYEVPPGLWDLNADGGQISQLLQQLMRNAVEAMPGGGELRLLLANEEIAAGRKTGLQAGRYVRLTLSDTGEGISAENLPRIFEPYFSTRKSGGLGLATAYSIVKKHHGVIEVESTPGQGTTFRLWLPAAETIAPRPEAPPTPAPRTVPPRAPRIMLMDDEESIRQMGALALERMGLEATMVADGAAAMNEFDAARQANRPYDLVILDLTIRGGMGGRETIELMRAKDPDLLAIVSSGYSSDPVMANYALYGFQAVVPKPYGIEQFTRTVTRLLEEGRGVKLGSSSIK